MGLTDKPRRFRAMIDLVYSDLLPDKLGQPLAKKGEITELYPELLRYEDRIQLLIQRGFIEEVTDVQEITRPEDSAAGSRKIIRTKVQKEDQE